MIKFSFRLIMLSRVMHVTQYFVIWDVGGRSSFFSISQTKSNQINFIHIAQQRNDSLQVAMTDYLIQIIIYVKCGSRKGIAESAWATPPSVHRGDLEEDTQDD